MDYTCSFERMFRTRLSELPPWARDRILLGQDARGRLDVRAALEAGREVRARRAA